MKKKKQAPKQSLSLFAQAVLLTAAFAATGTFFLDPEHAYFPWQKIPAFYAVLGAAGALLLMGFAKFIGKQWLYRGPDYYQE